MGNVRKLVRMLHLLCRRNAGKSSVHRLSWPYLERFQDGCVRVEQTFRSASRLLLRSPGFQSIAPRWTESLTKKSGVHATLNHPKPRKSGAAWGPRSRRSTRACGYRNSEPSLYVAGSWFLTTFALLLVMVSANLPSLASNAVSRKQEARDQFEKAEQMREALNGRPEEERTRRDYQRVADAYRKVYYVAPDSSKADASVVAVAELLAGMGRQFEPDDKDLNEAIHEYEFLRHEYPGSKYRFQALFTIGQIYKEDLGDEEAARKTFEEFLAHYPRNSLAPEAKKALAELNRPKPAKKTVEEARAEPPGVSTTDSSLQPVTPKKPGLPMVTGIRHWSTPDYTRVAIDVDREVKYEAGRVSGPDRIFFDLPDTKLASVLVGKSFDVQDGFLKKIRVAQYQPGYTRVVLEVADVSDYSAFLLPNPYRLIIDIHGRQPHTKTQVAQVSKPTANDEEQAASAPRKPEATGKPNHDGSAKQNAAPKTTSVDNNATAAVPAAHPPSTAATSSEPPHRKVVVDENDEVSTDDLPPPVVSPAKPHTGKATPSTVARAVNPNDPLFSDPG